MNAHSILILFIVTLGFYSVSFLFCLFGLITKEAALKKMASLAAFIGFLLQTVSIAAVSLVNRHLPFGDIYQVLAFLSWAVMLLYYLAKMKFEVKFLDLPVLFVVIFLYAAGRACITENQMSPLLRSKWFGIHAGVSLGAYAAFAIALLSGALYLIEERRIKLKKPVIAAWFPSLEALDVVNYRAISIGFFLLTLGIVTGSIWAEAVWGSWWNWDAKEVWSLATWLIYAALFHIRLTSTLRGRKVAILSILGFAFVLFTFLGANYILPGAHKFF